MCGLIYGRSKNEVRPINKVILKQYLKQKNRGIRGFGIYDSDFSNIIKETEEKNILKWLNRHPSSEILFHHRLPTSTDNTKSSAHPFSTKDYFPDKEYILIHNGHISNSKDLAEAHREMDIKYWSIQDDGRFNDSESLLWEVALYLEGKKAEIDARGNVAFICIEKNKFDKSKNKLHYFHNNEVSSPLYLRETKKFYLLASEDKDRLGKEIPINKLFTYSYEDGNTVEKALTIPLYTTAWHYPKTYNHTHTNDTNDDFEKDVEAMQEEFDSMRSEIGYIDEVDEQLALIKDDKKFSNDIRKTCIEYLNYAEGYYEIALGLMMEALEELDEEQYSLDNWYEKELLRGARAVLLVDPKRTENGSESVHPLWNEKATPDKKSSSFQAEPSPNVSYPASKNTQLLLEHTSEYNGAKAVREAVLAQSSHIKDILHKQYTVPQHIKDLQIEGKESGLLRQIPLIAG